MVVLSALALAILRMAGGAIAQEPVLITGGTVVDVRASTEQPGQAILIEKGRIVAVGGADSLRKARAMRHIDARGRWIIPGIIDVHAHEADRRVLARALALGVTGTLTMPMGGDTLMPLERWSRLAESATPRLYLVPWMFSGEFPDNLFPGAFPVRKPRSTGEAHKFVEQVHRIGGRHLKVYLEDGELLFKPSTPIPNLSSKVLSEIVRTAHTLGIRVYAHAHTKRPIRAQRKLDTRGSSRTRISTDRLHVLVVVPTEHREDIGTADARGAVTRQLGHLLVSEHRA
jgi:hypothetical protein